MGVDALLLRVPPIAVGKFPSMPAHMGIHIKCGIKHAVFIGHACRIDLVSEYLADRRRLFK